MTCGYGTRLPRIAAWTFFLPALFGVVYVLGGLVPTQAGRCSRPPDGTTGPEVLFDGLDDSDISFSTIGYGDIGWAPKVLAANQGTLNGLFFTLPTVTLFERVLGGASSRRPARRRATRGRRRSSTRPQSASTPTAR